MFSASCTVAGPVGGFGNCFPDETSHHCVSPPPLGTIVTVLPSAAITMDLSSTPRHANSLCILPFAISHRFSQETFSMFAALVAKLPVRIVLPSGVNATCVTLVG